MKKNLKIIGMGALAALGLASAAVAQQSSPQKPAMSAEQHRQMMSGGMENGRMTGMMMNDPEMRKQMTEMMSNCNRMMEKMGNMSGKDMKPKS